MYCTNMEIISWKYTMSTSNIKKQREQDKFVLVLQNASLSCQPVSKCVRILLNGYLLNICTFRQGREWVCPKIKLPNLSVCGSKTAITVDLFPFSISISKNTLLQFVKCPNKLMMLEIKQKVALLEYVSVDE